MLNLKTLLAGSTLALVSLGVFAQATTPATPRADKREAIQQGRIQKGVDSGSLNATEANRLNKQEAAVGK